MSPRSHAATISCAAAMLSSDTVLSLRIGPTLFQPAAVITGSSTCSRFGSPTTSSL